MKIEKKNFKILQTVVKNLLRGSNTMAKLFSFLGCKCTENEHCLCGLWHFQQWSVADGRGRGQVLPWSLSQPRWQLKQKRTACWGKCISGLQWAWARSHSEIWSYQGCCNRASSWQHQHFRMKRLVVHEKLLEYTWINTVVSPTHVAYRQHCSFLKIRFICMNVFSEICTCITCVP